MTEEQYKRAVQVNDRLRELELVKKDIEDTKKHRLWYAYRSGEFGSSWSLSSEWSMRLISKLLDKHDLMIREEIDNEIEQLKKEIETL